MEIETWKYGEIHMETWRNGDMETWKHEGMETWKHGDMDMEIWRHQTENGKQKPRRFSFIIYRCLSCKRKFVICPFVEETNGSYPFANRINGLNGLAHLLGGGGTKIGFSVGSLPSIDSL